MKKTGSITVVITTYNNSDILEHNISSILNQDLPVDQLIIIDDNSKDNTVEKINKIFQKEIDNGIINIFVNEKNYGGPAHGRNIGISETKSKYIFFCDGDDIWDNRLTYNYFNIFKKNEFDIVSSERFFFRKVEEIKFKAHGNLKKYKLSSFDFLSNPVCTSSVGGKTSIFKRFMFNEEDYMRGIEDYDCFLRMKAKKINFCKLENKFLFYKKANNSLSSNKIMILRKLVIMFQSNYIKQKNIPKNLTSLFAYLRVILFILHKIYKVLFKKESELYSSSI